MALSSLRCIRKSITVSDQDHHSINTSPPMEAKRGSGGSSRGKQRWISHYSSDHDILLVGEGDFSFAVCLAIAFESGTNIVATSLDTYDELLQKYWSAYGNLTFLQAVGATLLHGVDATKENIIRDLRWRKFHRIIFNFPHVGFVGKEDEPRLIGMHRNLVRSFLRNASNMLWPDGEIHINHKITVPFNRWNIEELAPECGLRFDGTDKFKLKSYPGYHNKRGSGLKPDHPFPLGPCRTFKFKLNPSPEKILKIAQELDAVQITSPPVQAPANMHAADSLPLVSPLSSSTRGDAHAHLSDGLKLQLHHRNECQRIFSGYINMVETFGSTTLDVHQSIHNALMLGFDPYMGEVPSSCQCGTLEELKDPRGVRSELLKQMPSVIDAQNSASCCGS